MTNFKTEHSRLSELRNSSRKKTDVDTSQKIETAFPNLHKYTYNFREKRENFPLYKMTNNIKKNKNSKASRDTSRSMERYLEEYDNQYSHFDNQQEQQT